MNSGLTGFVEEIQANAGGHRKLSPVKHKFMQNSTKF